MPKSCRNVVNLDENRLYLDQFVDTFEDFFALVPRKFARAKNRVIIDCEPSANAGYCGKFTISDSTGYCGVVSKPLAEHMNNMLHFHANCLSPLSGVSFFLLNLLTEINTTKCQWVVEYSDSKIDSINAVFTTDGCDTKYYIPLYRSACNSAYLHLDSSSLSVIQNATIQYLSNAFIDNNSIIFDANLPFRHLPCHNISYKSEMPKLSFDDFARSDTNSGSTDSLGSDYRATGTIQITSGEVVSSTNGSGEYQTPLTQKNAKLAIKFSSDSFSTTAQHGIQLQDAISTGSG